MQWRLVTLQSINSFGNKPSYKIRILKRIFESNEDENGEKGKLSVIQIEIKLISGNKLLIFVPYEITILISREKFEPEWGFSRLEI